MARMSQRIGPTADYSFVQANVQELIPGMTITRFFDEGELLILYTSNLENGGVPEASFRLRARVDGQSPALDVFHARASRVMQGQAVALSGAYIKRIASGIHTIQLTCEVDVVPDTTARESRSSLVVIQLPQWDSAADVLEST